MSQELAIYALTAPAARTARQLAAAWPGAELFLPARLAQPQDGEKGFDRFAQALATNFQAYQGHVALLAAGVVVRALQGLIKSKDQDPAVLVMDAQGRFAVSLLAGHLGGANHLAHKVAALLGGQAVITTATDSAGLPALEVLALEAGLVLENLSALAGLARRLVEGQTVLVHDPGGWLWPCLDPWPGAFVRMEHQPAPGDGPLVWVDWRALEPWSADWLVLRPPCLMAGMGCNRGTSFQELHDLLHRALARAGLSPRALAGLASIEAKRHEPGLIQLARELGCGINFYPAQDLDAVEVPHPSSVPALHVNTRSVCEAAALLAANSRRLLIAKTKSANATLAMALAGSM